MKFVKKEFVCLVGMLLTTMLYSSPILIITHAYNRPDFIEIQYKTFKKFLRDEYKFVVFNDAPQQPMCNNIKAMCDQYGIECIRIPQEIHTRPYLERKSVSEYNHSCARCANVVQYSLDILGFAHNGIVMIIDSDMFLVRPLSIKDYLGDKPIAGVAQWRGHVKYLWNGLVMMNMPKIPDRRTLNFNCGCVESQPCDVGGFLYYYFKSHPVMTYIPIRHLTVNDDTKVAVWHEKNKSTSYNLSCTICGQKRDQGVLMPLGECRHVQEVLGILGLDQYQKDLIVSGARNIEFYLDNHLLHYRSGGNWDNRPVAYHKRKTALINNYLERILNCN